MEMLEFEVKFYLTNIRPMRQTIIDLGARSQGRFFERNWPLQMSPLTTLRK
jgi:hypothetical protein